MIATRIVKFIATLVVVSLVPHGSAVAQADQDVEALARALDFAHAKVYEDGVVPKGGVLLDPVKVEVTRGSGPPTGYRGPEHDEATLEWLADELNARVLRPPHGLRCGERKSRDCVIVGGRAILAVGELRIDGASAIVPVEITHPSPHEENHIYSVVFDVIMEVDSGEWTPVRVIARRVSS